MDPLHIAAEEAREASSAATAPPFKICVSGGRGETPRPISPGG